MENFCLYNGKKIVKPEIWDITSIELSSDYTSAIIQAESKSNKSEYTLDITPLISNQYKNGIDPYSSTIVNELTGVSDWIIDLHNNQIKYYEDTVASQASCNQILHASGMGLEWQQNTGVTSISCAAITYDETSNISCSKITYKYKDGGGNELTNNAGNFCVSDQLFNEREEKYLPLDVVAQKVIANAQAGNTDAQNSIVSTFNNITDGILTSDYSEFFEQNKQPK